MTLSRRALFAAGAALALAPPAPAGQPAIPPLPPAVPPAPPPPMRSRWVPSDHVEEVVEHLEDDPSAWLLPRDGGHVLADRHGNDPDDSPFDPDRAPLLRDGEVVALDRTDELGGGVLTVLGFPTEEEVEAGANDEYRWTLDRPEPKAPPGATLHVARADEMDLPELCVGDLAQELDPGTYPLVFYAWSSHRFVYRAATGTLEPLEAPHAG